MAPDQAAPSKSADLGYLLVKETLHGGGFGKDEFGIAPIVELLGDQLPALKVERLAAQPHAKRLGFQHGKAPQIAIFDQA